MKIGKRALIGSGAIARFFIGETISGMFFGDVFHHQLMPRHIVVIVFFMIAGGFIGHVMRHAPADDNDRGQRNGKDS